MFHGKLFYFLLYIYSHIFVLVYRNLISPWQTMTVCVDVIIYWGQPSLIKDFSLRWLFFSLIYTNIIDGRTVTKCMSVLIFCVVQLLDSSAEKSKQSLSLVSIHVLARRTTTRDASRCVNTNDHKRSQPSSWKPAGSQQSCTCWTFARPVPRYAVSMIYRNQQRKKQKSFSVLRKKEQRHKQKKLTTAFGKSLFLIKYRVRWTIYMPPNTKDLAINRTMVAYGNRQNASVHVSKQLRFVAITETFNGNQALEC